MAEGEVNYKLTSDASGFTSEVAKAERSVTGLDESLKKTTKTAKDVGSQNAGIDKLQKSFMGLGKTIAALGVASLGLAFAKMVKETSANDAAMAQLNATLKSTHGVAGKTAEELTRTASNLQKMTTYADDSIVGMQSLLLTFKSIKGDNFDRTTKAVLDMSTAMNKDLQSSAIAVGKALNDPIKGVTALGKAGVQFSNDQKELIKSMVETGQQAEAQKLILAELESQFGGSAEAARNTLGGALQALGNSWGDLFEMEKKASDGMAASINDLNKTISDSAFKESIDTLVQGLINVVNFAAQGTAALVHMYQVVTDQEKKTLWTLGDKIGKLQAEIKLWEERQGDPRIIAQMKAELVGLEQEYVKLETQLVKTARGNDQLNEVVAKGTKYTTTATVETKKNTVSLKELGKENTTLVKTFDKLEERHKKAQQSMSDGIKEIDDLVASNARLTEELEFEVSLLGKTEREQARLTAVRKYENTMLADQAAHMVDLTMRMYDAEAATAAVTEAQDPFQKALQGTVERIDEAFAAAWEGSFDSFEDFADGLKDGFKKLIAELAHMAITRPIVMQIGAAFGMSAASGPAAASGGVLGTLGSMFTGGTGGVASMLQGGVTGLSAGVYSSIGDMATRLGMDQFAVQAYQKGLTTNLSSIGIDMAAGLAGSFAGGQVFGPTSGVGGTVGGIAGSIIGMGNPLFTAAGSFLGTGADRLLGNVLGFGGQGENDAGRSTFNLANGRITTAGVGGKFDQENVDAAGGLTEVLKRFSDIIGGSDFSGSVKVGNRSGITMGGTKYDSPEAFFQAAFDSIIEGATSLEAPLRDMLLGFEGTAEQMMVFANAMISLDEMRTVNSVTAAIEDFNRVQPTMMESYHEQIRTIETLITNFDGSASAADELAAAMANNKAAAYDFAMAIQALGEQLGQAASAQAASIRESVMTEEELRTRRQFERDILQAQLPNMTNVEQINETTNRILELNRQLFDTLPEELRAERAEAFAEYAEWTGTVAQQVLDKSISDMQSSQERINAQVSQMLNDTAARQQQAANTMQTAAQQFAAVVTRLQTQGIQVTVTQRASQVNV